MQQNVKTFSWEVDAEPKAQIDYGVKIVKFGDGYEERQGTTIGRPLETWSVKHTADIFDVSQIKNFLDEHRGVYPFAWVDPLGASRRVVVDKFDIEQVDGRVWRVSFEMREVRG